MNYKIFNSSDTNVKKFVFESEEGDIAVEAVLYRYESYAKRTVICCSTQCGCPVGCIFCGTGKSFIRNLTYSEIVEQIVEIMDTIDCEPHEIEKFQIMFMSMGEPLLNFDNVEKAIRILHKEYPTADLLISTSAPSPTLWTNAIEMLQLCEDISKVGLQFSIHESNDDDRSKLIPTRTSSLHQIALFGTTWAQTVGRKPFFNYCVHENNNSLRNVEELVSNFDPDLWEVTLSVICEKDQTMKNAIETKVKLVNDFALLMTNASYSVRQFNPAGQDDIGGGCGQLWYFNEWRNKQKKKLD